MRPLPTEPLAGQPPFVRGVSIIRGRPTPVVDIESLISSSGSSECTRFVTLRTGGHRVALAVASVAGLKRLKAGDHEQLPPLLRSVGDSVISMLGTLDADLLAVLDASRVLPDEAWMRLEKGE